MKTDEHKINIIKEIISQFEIKTIGFEQKTGFNKIILKNIPDISIVNKNKENPDMIISTEFNSSVLKSSTNLSKKYLFIILEKQLDSRIISDTVSKNWSVLNMDKAGLIFLLEKRVYSPMSFPPSDSHFDRKTDRYQYHTYVSALKYLNKKRIALDIGAHVGLYTRALSESFQFVNSFEPFPVTFDCLTKNTRKLSNVKLHNIALGDTNGKVDIDFNQENSGNSAVIPGSKFELQRLDNFNFIDIDFIKIDVEGYEHNVLAGGLDTIRRNKPVMIVEVKKKKEINEKAIKIMTKELNYNIVEMINKDYIFIPKV